MTSYFTFQRCCCLPRKSISAFSLNIHCFSNSDILRLLSRPDLHPALIRFFLFIRPPFISSFIFLDLFLRPRSSTPDPVPLNSPETQAQPKQTSLVISSLFVFYADMVVHVESRLSILLLGAVPFYDDSSDRLDKVFFCT